MPDVGLDYDTSESIDMIVAKAKSGSGRRGRRRGLLNYALVGAALGAAAVLTALLVRFFPR